MVRKERSLNIGSRLELFVDDWLIDTMRNVLLKLHRPIRREIVLYFDAPWEGPSSAYVTVMKDDDRYRMYYRGSGYKGHDFSQVTCYAESKNGIEWIKPSLGIYKFKGSTDNNIVWTGEGTHNFTPFKDQNPNAHQKEKYKAVAAGPLIALVSPDGINWKKEQTRPIITEGKFDSQNLAFWDVVQHKYIAYIRDFREGFRQIKRSTSPDFTHWTKPEWIDYDDAPLEHMYTNATTPYFRAPHIYLAFPKRFVPERKKIEEHPNKGVSDAVFMSSRDSVHWDRRFMQAFIRPGLDPNNWTQRSNMPAWGIVPTETNEISIYLTEHYTHSTCRLRRATLRTDGFVSVHASYEEADFVTKPLKFRGNCLVINYSTSAVGSIEIKIQDAKGTHDLMESEEIYGDEIEHIVEWKEEDDLSHLVGKPIRMKFLMKDADLYTLRFLRRQ